jgi:transcriptional regulator with XRE-family HTH domain
MGRRHPRPQPDRLASKFHHIRTALGYTLEEMAEALKDAKKSPPAKAHVYRFETGQREPSLFVLLQYARVANVSVEALIDDELDLPDELPANPKSEGVSRAVAVLRSPSVSRTKQLQ